MNLRKFLNKFFITKIKSNSEEDYLKKVAEDVGSDWISAGYYEQADQESWTQVFWHPESLFRRMFDRLDSTIIIELACGHGRHSAQMKSWDNQKILMDINRTNIDFCIKRFAGDPRYTMLVNDGCSCRPLSDMSCTAVFSYDAMVHFDSEIVFSYLRDIFRVLKPGGCALLHHSNSATNPGGNFRKDPSWRNYMTQSLFMHYSLKTRFNVLDSVTMDWDGRPDLDCLTLISKTR